MIAAWPEVLTNAAPPACPYRGLQAFTAADADAGLFVGREEEVARLRTMVNEQPLTLVVGPSGVGKTSLVCAGLIPALRAQGWLVASFRPSAAPVDALARAMLEIEQQGRTFSFDQLTERANQVRGQGFWTLGSRLSLVTGRRVAFVCDQLEEALAVNGAEEGVEQWFIDTIMQSRAGMPGLPDCRLVCTLRADFLPALLDQPGLGQRLQDRQLTLSPLSMPALTRVIVEPARLADVTYAPNLAESIAKEASKGRGGLPLLEFTLTGLWGMQRERRLSFDDYHALGGVSGALNRHAERAYRDLTADLDEACVRRVLLRMIRTRSGAANAIRVVVQRRYLGDDWPVAEALARPEHRLVVLGPASSAPDGGTAEIAHEALIREWHRLAAWVDDDAEFQRWLTIMEDRAADGDLLSDARIGGAQKWLAERRADIPADVIQLVARSRSALQRRLDELEEARRASEAYFRTLVLATPDMIVIVDDDNLIRYASPSTMAIAGSESLVGTSLADMVEPASRSATIQQLDLVRAGAYRNDSVDWQLPRPDGNIMQVEVYCRDLRHDPTIQGLVVTLRDVTDRRLLERRLTHQALHDPLTGLANRALFQEQLRQAVARSHATAGLLLVDLDDFGAVNEALGHTAGDELLVAVGHRLADALGVEHVIARLGGDDFAALIQDAPNPAMLEALAERVLRALAEPLETGRSKVLTTASIGLAGTPAPTDGEELLRQANIALHAAKNAGKARWQWYGAELNAAVVQRSRLRLALEQALSRDEFYLEYQPIVALSNGRSVGFEALVRWRHPELGLLTPDQFIPIAEDTGLIVPIGTWVLAAAITTAADWYHRLGTDDAPYVSVNVSMRQFGATGFVDLVRQSLANSGLPPRQLMLEITESILLHNDEQIRRCLHELAAMGVRLAIDDFGTGYSSLSYLREIPVDVLKIDGSFIATASSSPRQRALIDGIVRLSDILGLHVVAEGVESDAERDMLMEISCPFGQGYLFSRPLSYGEADRLVFPETRDS
jgi:diguanylate cyclase (GGDEF)-like protein/PAS domain S-box-containing protein